MNFPAERDGEQPRLLLWDLQTSRRRAELLLPETEHHPVFSADGRYVFADYFLRPSSSGESRSSHDLRWWDTESGEQVGEVINAGERVFLDTGRMLVTHSAANRDGREGASHTLRFWDVATGAERGEWDLVTNGRGITALAGSEGHRYLAAEHDPEYGVGLLDRRQLLLDVVDRREVARLPGGSAKWSRDGRWLATIDDAGIVRVWEMPVGPLPWLRPLGIAAVIALVCWAVIVFMGRRYRRAGPAQSDPRPPTSELTHQSTERPVPLV